MEEDQMIMDLVNAGLIRPDRVQIRIIEDQNDPNQTVTEVPEHSDDVPDQEVEVTEPVQNHVEEEHDQTVPENHSANIKKLSKKKRKTKKKNFGNKAKKRNQRNYRKFPAIRVEQQPQEDEIDFPLFDRDPAEPVDDPLPLKGKKIFKNF